MLADDRRQRILTRLRIQGAVTTSDLVSQLGVSVMTVRRDLEWLGEHRLLRRVRGGAVAIEDPSGTGAPAAPSAAGQLLHLGVLVPSVEQYFPRLLKGIATGLAHTQAHRSLAVSTYEAADEWGLIERLLAKGAQGLLIAPSIDLREPDTTYVERITGLPVPTVLLERTLPGVPDSLMSSVRTGAEDSAAVALEHLLALGHRRVALVLHGVSQTSRRLEWGWIQACRRHGVERSLVLADPETRRWPSRQVVDDALEAMLADGVTAVVVQPDKNALALRQRAEARGVGVPDDLSIVSYGDELAGFADSPFTAVSPNTERVGEVAARLLLEQLAAQTPIPRHSVVIAADLRTRTSTAPPGGSDATQ